jgi:molybdate transport repressor ModE-like protein
LEWSDLKVFLAMTDFGSVRNAAKKLGVSYSTVSRHIANLERDLGVRLFDRLPGGYSLTADGADILQEARQIKEQFHAVERRILGQDRKLSGTLKVTLPEILSSSFLMEEIVAFIKQYPDIELDVITSYETLSLNNREADVAIRVTNQPPQDLVGRKLSAYAKANYASRDYLDRVGVENLAENGFWLGWDNDETYPEWVTSSAFPPCLPVIVLTTPCCKSAHCAMDWESGRYPVFWPTPTRNLSACRTIGCRNHIRSGCSPTRISGRLLA